MSNGVVIGICATGMLTTADYDRVLVPKGAELSQKFETLRALSYMDQDFRGWDFPAAWAKMKVDFRFRGNLDKVAIVGALACRRIGGGVSLLDLFMRTVAHASRLGRHPNQRSLRVA